MLPALSILTYHEVYFEGHGFVLAYWIFVNKLILIVAKTHLHFYILIHNYIFIATLQTVKGIMFVLFYM